MQKVKLFKSVGSELEEMEKSINEWIEKSGARVISVTGNISPQSPGTGRGLHSFATSDLFVIVVYETP